MAVLIEANSVVIRVDSILTKYRGGINEFDHLVPNQTGCCDNELFRVGFMMPAGSDKFMAILIEHGLEYLRNNRLPYNGHC
jgi:hypothetical protein